MWLQAIIRHVEFYAEKMQWIDKPLVSRKIYDSHSINMPPQLKQNFDNTDGLFKPFLISSWVSLMF